MGTQIDAMAQIAPEDVPSVVAWDGVGEPPPEMLLAHIMDTTDTNGDGMLDAQEMGADEDKFRQIDKNGDGLIDVNELKEIIKKEEMKEDSVIEEAPRSPLADGDILGFYTSSQGGELVCISKLDGSKYYSISQGGIKKSNMMLAAEFKENGVLNFKPYAITGEFKAGQITWSNGTVYAISEEEAARRSTVRSHYEARAISEEEAARRSTVQLQKALDTDVSRIAAETAAPAALPQGSHELLEAITQTAFELAWSLYQDGHRLTESQFGYLGRLLDGYRKDYNSSGGWDDEARERKNNLSTGISLARGRCEECPQIMRA